MFRIAIATLVALTAAPALATPYYHAQPLAATEQGRFVLRDTVWTCGDDGCAAGESNSRPAIVCAVLAKEVGVLSRFSVGGEEISPEALEKCNEKAR